MFDEISTYKELHAYIEERLTNGGHRHYILLDEVQQITSWEKVINSFLVDANVDIYLTESNAYLLSSELSTLLSGRYVEIKMQPLSFKEYLDFRSTDTGDNRDSLQEKFNQYLIYGGLPTVVELLDHPDTIGPFLEGIYNAVLMKDVNLTSSGRKTTSDTIDNYLKMLENAFIIYKANRYDLKGKMFLKTLEKYYMVDMGIRNQLTGLRNTDIGHVLENLVYLELIRRGYNVAIGKIGSLEVDFVATKTDEKTYFQVSASILDEKTRERELRPLHAISDNYPKYIITLDQPVFQDYGGIRVLNIIDFLLEATD